MTRIVMASRRFQKDFLEFRKKYDDLDQTLREFLDFRVSHRPDEAFGLKDGRMSEPASKFRRCHLVHGKAILIYQLHGSEIRLVTIEEHNAVEGGTNRQMANYAKSLQPDDYYTFNIDEPVPAKPASPIPTPIEQVLEPEPVIVPEIAPVIEQEPPHINGTSNPLWDDKVVSYLQDQQMLYEPRPAQAMIAIILTKEIIAPSGDVLLIDPATPTIYHLSRAEFHAHFRPHRRHTTHLGEAIAAIVAPSPSVRDVVSDSVSDPVETVNTPVHTPSPTSASPIRRPARKNNIGAQIGRLIAVIAHLHRQTHSNKIDSASMKEMLGERDAKALSTTLFNAQRQKLVRKVGPKPDSGRAYYYCLSAEGEKQVKNLGNWPFESVGQTSPFAQNGSLAA